METLFAEEDRLANQSDTWQNLIYRKVPTPVDFMGIPGTGLNLGSLARKMANKPQLDYDFGRIGFSAASSLGRLTGGRPALEDYEARGRRIGPRRGRNGPRLVD
jgi:hypothetical protein